MKFGRLLLITRDDLEKARRAGVQSVVDYLKEEIATQKTRSAGIPKLKARLDAVEKTVLQTVIYALEEWLASPSQDKGGQ